jgi:hypothetical protein
MFQRLVDKLKSLLSFSNTANHDELSLKNSDETGIKSEAAKLAIENPPSCIASFNAVAVEREGDIDIAARFALSCKNCGSNEMNILCYPLMVKTEGEYAGIAVGQIIERNPHKVQCLKCGNAHLVFNANKHGYDGALGHGSSYSNGTGKAVPIECADVSYNVEVIFVYNNEIEENREIAQEKNLRPQDLFDWFHIIAVKADGTELKDINYECA